MQANKKRITFKNVKKKKITPQIRGHQKTVCRLRCSLVSPFVLGFFSLLVIIDVTVSVYK